MDVVVTNGVHQNIALSYETKNEKSLWLKFLAFIGAHEFRSAEMWRASLTEMVGSTFATFALVGSIIGCMNSNVAAPVLLVPIVVFCVTFFILIAVAPISGGFINPTFTFIASLKGVVTISRAIVYIVAQFIGTTIGFLLLKSVMSHDMTLKYFLAGCTINAYGGTSGISPSTAFVLEFSCTFLMCLLGVTVAFDKKRSKELGPIMVYIVLGWCIALPVLISSTITGSVGYSGVGLNPARCLAPALLYGGPQLWNGFWVFLLGPFFACIMYYIFSINLPKEGLSWVEGEYDISKLAGVCFKGPHDTPEHV
ncbi:unnamed protein product [Lupinus luteus]|uniref:Uncharacterized protein n=1 Tax=Lupinus luteus TaxID=3873 RepID=A0AAV1Y5R8_LUPLU